MVDILFLAKGRKEFTKASLTALLENTRDRPPQSRRFFVLTDGDYPNVVRDLLQSTVGWCIDAKALGGPVACLNETLRLTDGKRVNIQPSEFIAKIDNDTIVPPGWLEACLDVMRRYPEVDLLGLEPWAPDLKLWSRWIEPCGWKLMEGLAAGVVGYPENAAPRRVSHIGGIGLFRRSAFERFGKPTPNSTDGRYGFTEWQWNNRTMVKAFLDPPLPVFLLDHLPFEPWLSLSKQYEDTGIQRRQWGFYDPIKHKALWDWWVNNAAS